MNERRFDFAVGIVLITASLVFFVMPVFVPFLFVLISFIMGVRFFLRGHNGKRNHSSLY